MSERENVPVFSVNDFNRFPYYDNIKDEPGFKKTMETIESKYFRERERRKNLLIDMGFEKARNNLYLC